MRQLFILIKGKFIWNERDRQWNVKYRIMTGRKRIKRTNQPRTIVCQFYPSKIDIKLHKNMQPVRLTRYRKSFLSMSCSFLFYQRESGNIDWSLVRVPYIRTYLYPSNWFHVTLCSLSLCSRNSIIHTFYHCKFMRIAMPILNNRGSFPFY